eukprot:scaffold5373_cov68-Phaeocystis_antarctica.AAC.12
MRVQQLRGEASVLRKGDRRPFVSGSTRAARTARVDSTCAGAPNIGWPILVATCCTWLRLHELLFMPCCARTIPSVGKNLAASGLAKCARSSMRPSIPSVTWLPPVRDPTKEQPLTILNALSSVQRVAACPGKRRDGRSSRRLGSSL